MNYVIILVVLIICLLYFVVVYNKLIKLNNSVNESFATSDVYLKKRSNLVEIVKGYAKHEKDTFKEVTLLRNGNYGDLSNDDKIKANEELIKGISKIMVLAEAYLELKANENFLQLSRNFTSVENEIAQSRKYYNAVNNKVEMIPSKVAKVLDYKSKLLFTAREKEKQNIKVIL